LLDVAPKAATASWGVASRKHPARPSRIDVSRANGPERLNRRDFDFMLSFVFFNFTVQTVAIRAQDSTSGNDTGLVRRQFSQIMAMRAIANSVDTPKNERF
jgi:hypothetical protein